MFPPVILIYVASFSAILLALSIFIGAVFCSVLSRRQFTNIHDTGQIKKLTRSSPSSLGVEDEDADDGDDGDDAQGVRTSSQQNNTACAVGDNDNTTGILSSSNLNSFVNDENLIGGSPRHLSPLRGPTVATLAFRVYAPPSLDKEIPKVDLVGAMTFLRTGKIRTFVPFGAKRLLVLNFREMTLEIYMPKQGRHHKKHDSGLGSGDGGISKKNKKLSKNDSFDKGVIFPMAEENAVTGLEQSSRPMRQHSKVSGINISTRKLKNTAMDDEEEGMDDFDIELEDEWSPHNFESMPTSSHKLNELVSISALAPRHGGSVEIMYHAANSVAGKINSDDSYLSAAENKNNFPKTNERSNNRNNKRASIKSFTKSQKKSFRNIHVGIANESIHSESDEIEKWLGEFNQGNSGEGSDHSGTNGTNCVPAIRYPEDDDGRLDYKEPTILVDDGLSAVAAGLTDDVSARRLTSRLPNSNAAGMTEPLESSLIVDADCNVGDALPLAGYRRDEFVFLTPRDAAEFQRIVMALRTAGREMSHLYETLEAIQATSEAHFPELVHQINKSKKKDQDGNGKKKSCPIPTFAPAGVALDDAWRCLNDIPVIREGLQQLYHYSTIKNGNEDDMIAAAAAVDNNSTAGGNADGKVESGDEIVDNEEIRLRRRLAQHYRERRALIGIVDFFFLFVPPLPMDSLATPYYTPCAASQSLLESDSDGELSSGIENHYKRLHIASALHRRVSRAALYVRSYAWAKIVVHDGWQLNPETATDEKIDANSLDGESSLNAGGDRTKQSDDNVQNEGKKKEDSPNSAPAEEVNSLSQSRHMNNTRLAYDDDRENWVHDARVQNECYEATVGRDVTAMVRNASTDPESDEISPPLINSSYQGYSLVGWHAFEIPALIDSNKKTKFWLDPNSDPIECIPSLRKVVEKYPDSHFVVLSHFQKKVATYFLYVRSLPLGVDTAFDKTVSFFVNSSAKERDKMLELSCQLGPSHNWSSLAKKTVRALLIVWMRGDVLRPFRKKGRRERISFPGIRMTDFATLRHFGGSLQNRDDLPKNYVAVAMHSSWENVASLIDRIFLRCLQRHRFKILESFVVDFTVVLRAHIEDEFPERAIATIRMAHVELERNALPLDFCENSGSNAPSGGDEQRIIRNQPQSNHDTNDVSGWVPKIFRFGRVEKNRNSLPDTNAVLSYGNRNNELYTSSIDALYDILSGVTVRCPKKATCGLNGDAEGDNIMTNIQVLDCITRSDVERYVIACQCDLEEAAKRIVESAAWRAITFPIDTTTCRIELQSGQFFQHGWDKENNPIFYFRNMLPGLWRNDVDATTFSVLHRLESFMVKVAVQRPHVKVTLIVLMGCPVEQDVLPGASKNSDNDFKNDGKKSGKASAKKTESQKHHVHTNFSLVIRLSEILSRHYPERLAKALIVPSGGWAKTLGSRGIRSYVLSPITRARIHVLNSWDDLKKYVDEAELVSFVGGKAEINSETLKCGTRSDKINW